MTNAQIDAAVAEALGDKLDIGDYYGEPYLQGVGPYHPSTSWDQAIAACKEMRQPWIVFLVRLKDPSPRALCLALLKALGKEVD